MFILCFICETLVFKCSFHPTTQKMFTSSWVYSKKYAILFFSSVVLEHIDKSRVAIPIGISMQSILSVRNLAFFS